MGFMIILSILEDILLKDNLHFSPLSQITSFLYFNRNYGYNFYLL